VTAPRRRSIGVVAERASVESRNRGRREALEALGALIEQAERGR